MTFSIQNAQSVQALDAMTAACDVGTTNPNATLVIYSGTPPARVGEALAGNTVLSEHAMTNPAFAGSVDVPASNVARAIANAIANAVILATGTATFARILNRDEDPVQQLDVGTSGTAIIMPTTSLVAGATATVSSLVIDMPEAA